MRPTSPIVFHFAHVRGHTGHVPPPVQALAQFGSLCLQGVRGLIGRQRPALARGAHEPARVTTPHKRQADRPGYSGGLRSSHHPVNAGWTLSATTNFVEGQGCRH
jgi:hypothetical protein